MRCSAQGTRYLNECVCVFSGSADGSYATGGGKDDEEEISYCGDGEEGFTREYYTYIPTSLIGPFSGLGINPFCFGQYKMMQKP